MGEPGTTAPPAAGVVAVATHDAGARHGQARRGTVIGGGPSPARREPAAPLAGGDDPGWGGDDGAPEETAPSSCSCPRRIARSSGAATTRRSRREKVDMSSGGESRSLDDGEIQDVIAGQSGPVQSCVVIQAAANTDLHGHDHGADDRRRQRPRTRRSRSQAPHYMFEHGVLACVQGAVRQMKFPATGQSTLVTMPVNLTVTD